MNENTPTFLELYKIEPKVCDDLIDYYNDNVEYKSYDIFKEPKEIDSDFDLIIMRDVIEHIKIDSQKIFFEQLKSNYKQINLIGRTPNLKSPFGLRNSYGDNSHIYRFTDKSLKDFLANLGFKKIKVSSEPYKITGITSFLRYLPYLISIYVCSISFCFVYGQWEGFLTPNIVFYSEKV